MTIFEEIDWSKIKYFIQSDFDDPNYTESGKFIDPVIVYKLENLRQLTEWPIIVHKEVGGAVDVQGEHGHAPFSYHRKDKGCKAVDFHFVTKADSRLQYYMVEHMFFPAVGVYYDWYWNDKKLKIGFHVDERPISRYQRWTRKDGKYIYLLK